MSTRHYWLHALTPVHVGSGQGVGFIDLPIMREKTTDWPVIPGSTVKGVLRAHWDARTEANGDADDVKKAFGNKAGDDISYAGALVFTDARMVCLAVRSLYGTFAWVSCPMALRRLARDLVCGGESADLRVPESLDDESVLVPNQDSSALDGGGGEIFFNDMDFAVRQDDTVQQWALKLAGRLFPSDESGWRSEFIRRFAVVHDDFFNFFCETATEVSPHVRINPDTKTVQKGALWHQESIPAESVLAGMVWCDRLFSGSKDHLLPKGEMETEKGLLLSTYCPSELILQIGGGATTGKGRVRCLFTQGEDDNGR